MKKFYLYPTRELWQSRIDKLKRFTIEPGNGENYFKLTNKSKIILLMMMISLIITITYLPVLKAQATYWDDYGYFIRNQIINRLELSSVSQFFLEMKPSSVPGYYQPITMITFMADFLFSGGRTNDLRIFHRTNLMLHVLNCILILVLLYLLFKNYWIAAGVALLFGLHPLTVEPVAWIAERKTLLAAFFSLGALICYLRAIATPKKKYYYLALFLFLLALLSKPTAVPLPLAMLLLDFWPLARFNKQALIEKIPFILLSFIFAVIAYFSQKNSASVIAPQNTIIFAGNHFLAGIPLILSYDLVFYLSKFLYPVNLTPHYPVPAPFSFHNPLLLGGFLFSVALSVLFVVTIRKTKPLAIGCLTFMIMILPTSGVIGFTRVLTEDNYAYLPMIVGFLVPLAWLGDRLNGDKLNPGGGRLRKVLVISLAVILAVAEVRGVQNGLTHWRDTVALFQHITKLAPNEAETYCNLGDALRTQGKINKAIPYYQRALKMPPPLYWDSKKFYLEVYNSLGLAFMTKKEYPKADFCFRKILNLEPQNDQGYRNFGFLYASQGKYEQAIENFKLALKISPNKNIYYLSISKLYYKIGERQKGALYHKKFLSLSRKKGVLY